ncbi:MAG TPA: EamA family transporter, partial [Burkholderiaceae bacterium]|nr:EamA family transporter [Burkholderiaceae bacterium]
GVVEPEVSVVYRFALAAAILFVWCAARGQRLTFQPRTHAWLALQGSTLFGLNYVGVYLAERYVASGLVAVAFSTLVFIVPISSRLVFGTPVPPRVALGAVIGVAGVASLFLPELRAAAVGGAAALGVAFALGSTVIAAMGNLVTVRLQSDKVPTVSGTAWGMSYGALTAAAIAWISGSAWTFDWGFEYVASLVYLSVFGSIIAFVTYFKLLERVGANRASFTAVAIPVVAMALSTVFEGYQWTTTAAFGAALAFAGNYLALSAKR